jgi:hypothetical protein
MSWSRLLHRLLACYPPAWRARYGEEMRALVDDMLEGPAPRRGRLAAGLAFGAVREHVHPSLNSDDGERSVVSFDPRAAGFMRHYGLLYRRGLGDLAASSLEPGETVVGCFDATTSWPKLWSYSRMMPAIALGGVVAYLLAGQGLHANLPLVLRELETWAVMYVAARFWLWVVRSRRLTFVLTTHGLLLFENGMCNKPVALRVRMPAVAPELVGTCWGFLQVRLGNERAWVHKSSESVLRSMAFGRV